MFTCNQSVKTYIFLSLIKSTVIGYYIATMNLYLHIYDKLLHKIYLQVAEYKKQKYYFMLNFRAYLSVPKLNHL